MKQSAPPTLDRRKFLTLLSITAAAGLLYRYGYVQRKKGFTLRHSRQMMGTIVNITLLGPDQQSCQTALDATMRRMEHLAGILSRHDPASNLSHLNREGELKNPDPDLVNVLHLALHMSEQTQGAFDVTILPLLGLYGAYKKTGKLPDPATLARSLELVDYTRVSLSNDLVRFNKKGMGITLDGIGKGYIVDEGVKTLQDLGFDNVYLEAGGDLMVSGSKGQGRPWLIGIENPRPQQKMETITLELHNRAVATSGDYRQSFSEDKKYHHIINPRTGLSPAQLASCTITAPTVAKADGLATAAMVLGPEKSLELLESLPECGGFLIGKDLATHTTTGFLS